MVENLIVGCGLSGVVLAERIASQLNENVLVIDKKDHIGGNIFDYKDKNGITIHKYGPHIFHTEHKDVWDYLSNFTKWYYFTLKPQVVIDNKKVTLPFNIDTIYEVFPHKLADRLTDKLIKIYGYNKKVSILELQNAIDEDLKFLSKFVYEKVFEKYTMKQWGLKPEEIDPTVTARVPVYISRDNGYFQDKYQGIPINGYTEMIKNILNNPLIDLRLNTDFKAVKDQLEYKRIFYTGAIDEFFDYEYGALPYRSLEFDVQEHNMEYYQNAVVVNYPNNYDFTRICEHKYFLNEKSDKTVISIEYPQPFQEGKNERYYPISNKENNALYEKYLNKAKKLKNVHFLGRLGEYKYYNMDLIVKRALEKFEELR